VCSSDLPRFSTRAAAFSRSAHGASGDGSLVDIDMAVYPDQQTFYTLEARIPMPDTQEELQIDTPEDVALQMEVAGLGSRFAAFVLDFMMAGVVWLIIAMGGLAYMAAHRTMGNRMAAMFVIFGSLFFALFFYFAIYEAVRGGVTFGKEILGLTVVRDGGYPITWSAALIRNLFKPLDVLAPFLWIVPIVSTGHKRIGDWAAGTQVIRRRSARAASEPPPPPEVLRFFFSTYELARLSDPLVIEALDAWLTRQQEIDPERSAALGRSLADRLCALMGREPPPGEDIEEFLIELRARMAQMAEGAK
jgi:uncharacterized RDD family membrane protein YckC